MTAISVAKENGNWWSTLFYKEKTYACVWVGVAISNCVQLLDTHKEVILSNPLKASGEILEILLWLKSLRKTKIEKRDCTLMVISSNTMRKVSAYRAAWYWLYVHSVDLRVGREGPRRNLLDFVLLQPPVQSKRGGSASRKKVLSASTMKNKETYTWFFCASPKEELQKWSDIWTLR
jgi:hypothetical protein